MTTIGTTPTAAPFTTANNFYRGGGTGLEASAAERRGGGTTVPARRPDPPTETPELHEDTRNPEGRAA